MSDREYTIETLNEYIKKTEYPLHYNTKSKQRLSHEVNVLKQAVVELTNRVQELENEQ